MIVIKWSYVEEGSQTTDTEHGETKNNSIYNAIMFLMMDAQIQHVKVTT
jgi:hypothetical protein